MGKFIKEFASFSFFTLISRIFGFVRDIAIAYKMGAGSGSDIFFVALKLPNFFRRIFAEGALSQAFVPIYSKELDKDKSRAHKFASEVLFFIALSTFILTILVELFTPQIISLFAPGFASDPQKFLEVVQAARITFPYLFFISLVSFYSGMLYSHGVFAPGAVVPVIFNLGLIIGILFFSSSLSDPSITLSVSLLISGFVQLLFILLFVFNKRIFVLPRLYSGSKEQTSQFFKRLLPAAFAASIVQINVWVDMIFASYIPNSVSYLYYAERLVQLPLALIGTALGIVLLPRISKLLANHKDKETVITTERAILMGLLFAIPASMALFILSDDIFIALFMRGEFTLNDVHSCSRAMKILIFGMPAYVMIKITMPHFHARGDMKTPMFIAIAGVCINVLLNYFLMQKYSYAGIAIATAISAWFNYVTFYIVLKRKSFIFFSANFLLNLIKIGVAALFMSYVCLILSKYWSDSISIGGISAIAYLGAVISIALISYFSLCTILLGREQLKSFLKF